MIDLDIYSEFSYLDPTHFYTTRFIRFIKYFKLTAKYNESVLLRCEISLKVICEKVKISNCVFAIIFVNMK